MWVAIDCSTFRCKIPQKTFIWGMNRHFQVFLGQIAILIHRCGLLLQTEYRGLLVGLSQ